MTNTTKYIVKAVDSEGNETFKKVFDNRSAAYRAWRVLLYTPRQYAQIEKNTGEILESYQ